MPMTIQDALSKDMDFNVTLKATCLDVGELILVKGRHRFHATIADGTAACNVTVYNSALHSKFVKNGGVYIINALNKTTYMALTSRSRAGITTAVPVPDNVRDGAPRMPQDGFITIQDSMKTPAKSLVSIKGKVLKKSPASKKQANDSLLKFQEILIRDSSAATKVALWGDLVDSVSSGDLVRLRNCRVKLFQANQTEQEKKLSTTSFSSLEILHEDEDLTGVQMTDEDQAVSFQNDTVSYSWNYGMIDAIIDVDVYFGCPKTPCRASKTTTECQDDGHYVMRCNRCQTLTNTTSAIPSALAKLLVVNKDDDIQEITFFTEKLTELILLASGETLEKNNLNELKEQLTKILPCKIKFCCNKGVCLALELDN